MDIELAPHESDELDLDTLAKTSPEKAAILLDFSIKKWVTNEREGWIMKAKMLYYMKTTDLWQYHPEGFSSFFEYCAQPDIDIPPSVASDMLALCKYAPYLDKADIDIWDVVRKTGHSKVRQIIPQIREAQRSGVLKEEIKPLIDSIENMSFREVLGLTSTAGVREQYDLEATYQVTPTGAINVIFQDLDTEDLEYLSRKAGIKRWYDTKGNRIEPPTNEPEVKALKKGR